MEVAELAPTVIRELVPFYPVILEIGCNDGTDTLRFLEAMPGARIYCFEPDPRAIARFKKNVDDPRVTLIEAAVSDTDGAATFYGSSGRPTVAQRMSDTRACIHLAEWDLSGSLCKPTGHLTYSPWTTFPKDRQYQVSTMRLDTWMSGHPELITLDFIWCDVQGAEALVIQGGLETLAITSYFYTEFYDQPLYEGQLPLAGLRQMLPGFELLGTYGDNALFKNGAH